MGFFLKHLSHSILLHPQFFSPLLRKSLEQRLHDEVEGTCAGRFGYVISVIEIGSIGKGVLQPTTGLAEFNITYTAIVFKPFKNEVVDGIVTTVNKIGFWADVGPLQVFVSQHLIPQWLKFDANANPPAYVAEGDGGMDDVYARIEKGEMVRMRIVGTRVDAKEIFAIGSVKEDYLGPAQAVDKNTIQRFQILFLCHSIAITDDEIRARVKEEENNSIQMPLAFLQQQSTTSVGSRRSVASAVQLESRPLSNGDIPSSQGGRRRRNEFKETTEEPAKPAAEPSAWSSSTQDKRPSRKSFASEDTDEVTEQIKKTTLINNSNDDDAVIPMIPDLADLEDEEVIATVAAPPSVQVNQIQSISELEADLHDQLGVTAQISSFGGIDTSLLANIALCPPAYLEEKDQPWDWDIVFASLKSSSTKKSVSAS